MTRETWFNALCYEAGIWAISKWPSLAFSPWFKLLMAHCLPDWQAWKTSLTMQKVDEQAKELVSNGKRSTVKTRLKSLPIKRRNYFPPPSSLHCPMPLSLQ
jgi:hypothetical protein